MKCLVCTTGNIVESGCFLFCNNCDFVSFKVTKDYLSATEMLIGALVSNVQFKSEKYYIAQVAEHVEEHLPMLSNWLGATARHSVQTVIKNIADAAKTHAINLIIAQEAHNEQQDLQCICGKSDFTPHEDGSMKVICRWCSTVYRSDPEQNKYIPYFQCTKCKCLKFNEEEAGMVSCANTDCSGLYMHIKPWDTFQLIGG